MPDRERLRDEFFVTQLETFAFPNADLQHAIDDLEALSIDIAALERRRDRLVPALREMDYETTLPEGTFYVMARAPLADDQAFARILNRHKVLVLPGSIVELPGWFRISLTASDDMVERHNSSALFFGGLVPRSGLFRPFVGCPALLHITPCGELWCV